MSLPADPLTFAETLVHGKALDQLSLPCIGPSVPVPVARAETGIRVDDMHLDEFRGVHAQVLAVVEVQRDVA